MLPDLAFLEEFYARPLGKRATQLLRPMLTDLIENPSDQNILCCGYGLPYLEQLAGEARSAVAFMPAAVGVRRWPSDGQNRAALIDLLHLPVPDSSFDTALLIHGLEFAKDTEAFLNEIWRILVPSGRIIILVPNRRGLWSRSDHTPFGYGQPFTRYQLRRAALDSMFQPRRTLSALYAPPLEGRYSERLLEPAEKLGRLLWRKFSGVIVLEAEKRIFAGEPIAKPSMPLTAIRPATST